MLIGLLLLAKLAGAQELYVFTEPASNMPAHTTSVKMKGLVSSEQVGGLRMQRYTPEVMFGISKEVMVHVAGSFSNMATNQLRWEGAYLYGKYRFLSNDDVHQHFRMAAYTELGYSRNPMMFDEVGVRGENSGIEVGLVATQLVNKFAASITTGFVEVFQKLPEHIHRPLTTRAFNYSLSMGYLVLPREYTSYDQLNFNIYTEFLGQKNWGPNTGFIDMAPAIQFIFNSNTKLNLGYRFQLAGDAYRSTQKMVQISLEHTFFNRRK